MSRNGFSNSPVIPSLLNSSSSSPIRSTDDDVDGNAVATAANLRTSSDVSLNESSRVISSTRPLGSHDYSRYPSSTDVSLGSRTHLATTEVKRHFQDVENGIRSQRKSEKCGYPDDSLGASDPYSYYGGEKGFILYPNEIEEDDSLHLPADNDDITFKPKGYELSTKETIHFVTTANGYLQLRLERFPNHDLDFRSGPFQQGISTITTLNNSWYDGLAYQKYAYKYIPGTTNSKIAWFVGDDPSFIMDGRAVGPNGNIKVRQVAEEPMSIDSESGDEQYMDQD
ncbi:uncharacterized protein RSE6_03714 [Rhynchosporium secalis]|uniref:Uncharacterized protein n=1 Tax=Rhynchosporium secalis TaxID=38038 RepID=A0A1E1M3F7_RHYSE|nr:uncharacterized protein RSE6_03714 [Rhynchosporium secalis]